ncbi:DUF1330 domain-containing protein [Caulobacter sp. NIBR2454]|uniref:DUF1330 domain-containing protein n=1 Tax=Caulobacter sp. NIBR2454 TaxID=3015996 RepID=UPI0022B67E0C|nr:DUF1330 domain-containing protein [Caulobacter sp. NIBR2454]
MPAYVVAQVRFTDEPAYRRYQARFPQVFAGSGGRVLAADESPRRLSGDWPFDKLVIMEFPDEATADAFLNSEAYREISKDRDAGAETVGVLVRGIRS